MLINALLRLAKLAQTELKALQHINGFAALLAEDYEAGLDDKALGYLRRIQNGTKKMVERSSLCYSQTTGSGNAAGVEESRRQGCFDSLLILHVSNKLEAALQTPSLCVRFPVLPEVASPTTSPDLREVR